MKVKAAIFDYDGTIVDSMAMWRNLPSIFARKLGKEPVPDFDRRARSMSMDQVVAEFDRLYGLRFSKEEFDRRVMDMIHDFYKTEITLKEGVVDVLDNLQAQGIPMCVATLTPRNMILTCNERLGISDYFQEVFSCRDYGVGKDSPYIFDLAADFMNAEPEEVVVFEDMLTAVGTARNAGFRTLGICDSVSREDWDGIIRISDLSVHSLAEWPGLQGFEQLLGNKL